MVMRKMVLFPQPLMPMMQWKEPGSTAKLRWSMISKSSLGY